MELIRYLDATNGITLLKEKKLRLSNPQYFNDPFDCRISINDNDKDWQEGYISNLVGGAAFGWAGNSNVSDYNEDIKKSIKKEDREELKNYRITCFGSNYDRYQDTLMWGHYGASHTGIKIVFSEKFFKFIKKNFFLKEIEYSNKRINIVFGDTKEQRQEKIQKSMYHKSEVWKDEQEYRLIYNIINSNKNVLVGDFEGENGTSYRSEYLLIQPNWIKEVALGCNFPKNRESEIQDINSTNYKHCELKKARTCIVEYNLHYDDL